MKILVDAYKQHIKHYEKGMVVTRMISQQHSTTC